jgi:hypothetical protein
MIDNTGFGRGPTFDIEAFWRERSFSISAWSRGQTRVAVSGNQVIGFLLALPLSSEESWFELTYVGALQNYRGNRLFPKCLMRLRGWPVASMQM